MPDIVEAGQESRCGMCEEMIHVGDEIVVTDGEWCHVACVLGEKPTAELTFALMSEANARRCIAWHGVDWKSPDDQWTAADWSNAMAGEAGEAANVVKKLRRLECTFPDTVPSLQRHELLTLLADELADVVLYADLLAQKLDIDLGDAVRRKFNRKSRERGFEERI